MIKLFRFARDTKIIPAEKERTAMLRYDASLSSDDFLEIMKWIHEKVSEMNWEVIEKGIREKGEERCH